MHSTCCQDDTHFFLWTEEMVTVVNSLGGTDLNGMCIAFNFVLPDDKTTCVNRKNDGDSRWRLMTQPLLKFLFRAVSLPFI